MGDAGSQVAGNDGREVAIGFTDLDLDRTAIARRVGYPAGQMPDHFGEMLDTALEQATARCVIRAGFRLVAAGRIEKQPDAVEIGGIVFTTERIVASQLGRAIHAAVFACTIGPGMEQWAGQVMRGGDPALGYIGDAVASAVAEAVADRLHDHIGREMARNGWRVTNRYSPGYCNWSVAEQHKLFALLPAHFCGITLGESALMQPMKSVSGVVGVGPDVKYADYLCDVCGVGDFTCRSLRRPTTVAAHPN
jgi:hypothetical protein